MARAQRPLTFASASPAVPGTSVAPSVAVPDNCHTIIIVVPTGGGSVLYGQGVAGTTALTLGTNSAPIAAGQSLTLAVGTMADRGTLDGVAPNEGLIFDLPPAGAAVIVSLTYLCWQGTE
jgi:hypothetical protein